MATKFLDKTGLSHFWSKIKAWCNAVFAPIAHTHTSYDVKHSYTVAANATKNWYRIANANTSQTDTTKPIHAQFILTAYNASYDAGYYERWFVNAEVFGKNAHIVILGNTTAPFSQARILYENTIADLDANDRPAIDIYLNTVLANGTTKIEIEEVYNSDWIFVNNGQISASSVPTGFESVSCSVRNNGVERSTYADYASYFNRQINNITAAFTLADSYLYRSRTLNCTGTFTITIPSINSVYMWCVIKNKNTSSGVITLHPSTTSVLIDGSNTDITLQPMEYVCIHSVGANNYSLIADGRWKSQKADKATTLEGYGITDAKIANGTITLGSNSITPARLIDSGSFEIKYSSYVKGTLPSSSLYYPLIKCLDANNNNIGMCYGEYQTNGLNWFGILAYDCTGNSNSWSYLSVGYDSNGTVFTHAPTPDASSNNTNIATTAWVRTALTTMDQSNIVHRTNNETITGEKSFIDTIIKKSGYSTRGTIPSDSKYSEIQFIDSTGITWANNGNHGRFAAIQSVQSSDGYNQLILEAYKNARNSNDNCSLQLKISQDGYRFLDAYGSMHITDNSPYLELYDSNSRRTGGDNHPTLGIGFNDRVGDGYCDILFHDYGNTDDRPALSFYINSPWASESISQSIHFQWNRSNQSIWFGPGSSNTIALGGGYNLWKQLYASTTTISTSDKRFKDDINSVDEDLLDNWDNIEWVNFKFKDAIKEKGVNKARIHTGLVAQDIQDIFNSVGIDITKYGFFCFDKWDALDEVYDEKRKIKLNDAVEADYRYAIRYEEALCIEAAYQRRKNKILENRISELEKRLAKLEGIIQ